MSLQQGSIIAHDDVIQVDVQPDPSWRDLMLPALTLFSFPYDAIPNVTIIVVGMRGREGERV